jgi:hypothetical protein
VLGQSRVFSRHLIGWNKSRYVFSLGSCHSSFTSLFTSGLFAALPLSCFSLSVTGLLALGASRDLVAGRPIGASFGLEGAVMRQAGHWMTGMIPNFTGPRASRTLSFCSCLSSFLASLMAGFLTLLLVNGGSTGLG